MKLLWILYFSLFTTCGVLCLKDPSDTSLSTLDNEQGIVTANPYLLSRQPPSNATTDNENTMTSNKSNLTFGIQNEPTSDSPHLTAETTPTYSSTPSDSETPEIMKSMSVSTTPTPEPSIVDQPYSNSQQPTPTTPKDQPTSDVPNTIVTTTIEEQQSPIAVPTTTTVTETSSPEESAITSINPTLVLGDLECSIDPLAQTNGRCPADHYCNAPSKQCIAKASKGESCAADFQCQSGYCAGTCDYRPQVGSAALNGGQLVGITLGSVGGVIVLIIGLFYCHRKRRIASRRNQTTYKTEMTDANPRLSKYNYLTQILDDQRNDNRIPTSSEYDTEFYTNSLHPHSSSALRPRPFTGDLTPSPSIFSYTSRNPSESDSQSMDPYTYSLDYRYHTRRDSMTDTTLSSQYTHRPPSTNPLWDDALPAPRYQAPSSF